MMLQVEKVYEGFKSSDISGQISSRPITSKGSVLEGRSPCFTKISVGEILKFGQIFQSLNGYISEKPSI